MTQFFYLLHWNYLRKKELFILFTLAQLLLSISLLFGYPLVIGDIDSTTAYYLSSGSVLIGIISMGCTISSPVIANDKLEGHFDYIRALPIPRIFISLADLWMWLIAILPGVFISILLGYVRFSVRLHPSFLGVFIVLLICLTMISLGFAIAYTFSPNTVTLMSQLILMIGLMFSPLMYPADRLPEWVNHLYRALPFVPSSNLLRASLYDYGNVSLLDISILILWIMLTQLIILRTLHKEK